MLTIYNSTICITGTLKRYGRKKAFRLIEECGGTPKNNMSSKVDILVLTDEFEKYDYCSTKLDKAYELGTEIIDEDEFYELLEEA